MIGIDDGFGDAGIRIFASPFSLATVGLEVCVVVMLLQEISAAQVPQGASVDSAWGAYSSSVRRSWRR